MASIQTFDSRQPVLLKDPSDIRPDDWMADCGTLRQVDYVDSFDVKIGPGVLHIVHFKAQAGAPNPTVSITGGTRPTVWRALEHAEAVSDALA